MFVDAVLGTSCFWQYLAEIDKLHIIFVYRYLTKLLIERERDASQREGNNILIEKTWGRKRIK